MYKKIVYLAFSGGILLSASFVGGCASTYSVVAPTPPEKYEIIGPTNGTAQGSIGVFGTATNFAPMGLNGRIQRAYDNAIQNAPGATGLVDVTYQEDWYWWLIGSARKVTIQGTAIKEISQ